MILSIPKSTNGAISVKEYADKNHVSEQSVYAKIRRNSEKLKGHILRQNGKMLLDVEAQEILKPSDANLPLTQKVGSLEKELREKSYESEKLKGYGDTKDSECEKLKKQLAECNSRIEELEQELFECKHTIDVQEQELSEKRTEIAENQNRIDKLLSISDNVIGLAQRLHSLFGVLEETANSSVGKKIGSLLSGKH